MMYDRQGVAAKDLSKSASDSSVRAKKSGNAQDHRVAALDHTNAAVAHTNEGNYGQARQHQLTAKEHVASAKSGQSAHAQQASDKAWNDKTPSAHRLAKTQHEVARDVSIEKGDLKKAKEHADIAKTHDQQARSLETLQYKQSGTYFE